jgi:hypothetical protein
LIIEGSQDDIERLVSCIRAGEIEEISGFLIEDIQILNENPDDSEANDLNKTWTISERKIISQSIEDDISFGSRIPVGFIAILFG